MAEELKEKKPTLQQKAPSGISGGKIQPGSPLKSENIPVGINKTRFESDKHVDKRMNKMFKETGQPTLGVWNHDKKNNPMAKADKVQFNPALNKTKQINASLANKPIGKPDPDFENRQKIINQGFSPSTKPGQKYKWSEGLSDEDNEILNNSLNKIAAWSGEKDLSKVNKDWGSDLAYQMQTDGIPEETASRLGKHFNEHAPTYEEAFPEYKKPAKKSYNVTADGDFLGQVEAEDETEAERLAQQQYPGYTDDDLLGVEESEREQASELFGTDLNKPEGNEPDTSPLDVNDMPGTPVITSRLKDFMRYYLKQEGISPEFSETMINNIGNNPRQADWFKQKMKEYVDSKNGGNQ